MALSVVVLLGSVFLPVTGLKFDWLPIHWIAGVVLTGAVLFHLWRVFGVHGIGEMLPNKSDVELARIELLRQNRAYPGSAKYDAWQKAYHWSVVPVILVLLATGLLMLAKIDTAFWTRNPAILTDRTWGLIYVAHGAASFVLLFFIILHIYFSVLPDHRDLFVSMLTGHGPEKARAPQGTNKEDTP